MAPDGPVDNIWLRHGRSLLPELRVKPLAPQLARERSQIVSAFQHVSGADPELSESCAKIRLR